MYVCNDTSHILGCRFHLPTPPVDVAMLSRTYAQKARLNSEQVPKKKPTLVLQEIMTNSCTLKNNFQHQK